MGHTGKHSTKTLHGISWGPAGVASSGSPSVQDFLVKPCHSLYAAFASAEPNSISEVWTVWDQAQCRKQSRRLQDHCLEQDPVGPKPTNPVPWISELRCLLQKDHTKTKQQLHISYHTQLLECTQAIMVFYCFSMELGDCTYIQDLGVFCCS